MFCRRSTLHLLDPQDSEDTGAPTDDALPQRKQSLRELPEEMVPRYFPLPLFILFFRWWRMNLHVAAAAAAAAFTFV